MAKQWCLCCRHACRGQKRFSLNVPLTVTRTYNSSSVWWSRFGTESCSLFLCEKDPYVIFKWAEQEARTTVRRDAGKKCSWPKEELALIVRNKAQLQEPVEVEVSSKSTPLRQPCHIASWQKSKLHFFFTTTQIKTITITTTTIVVWHSNYCPVHIITIVQYTKPTEDS